MELKSKPVDLPVSVEHFFSLLLDELRENENLRGYYRFLNDEKSFHFRKAYYIQRLNFIANSIPKDKSAKIFDVGCGYGTTAFFLALNGYKVEGNTIEYYLKELPRRIEYWSRYGDLSGMSVSHEDLFEYQWKKNYYDAIISQDVLHHIEPIEKGLDILSESLVPGGRLIVCEENGKNLINNLRLFLSRGNKRVITIHDEKLGKNILLGNENVRSLKKWTALLAKSNLKIDSNSLHYIRLYLPFMINGDNVERRTEKEQRYWVRKKLVRDYAFHGLNFVAVKS
jgi:2-polyprenyl-3-methyl-5-hydroxy-6-metoxy-1,4-benzoquinol methylase